MRCAAAIGLSLKIDIEGETVGCRVPLLTLPVIVYRIQTIRQPARLLRADARLRWLSLGVCLSCRNSLKKEGDKLCLDPNMIRNPSCKVITSRWKN